MKFLILLIIGIGLYAVSFSEDTEEEFKCIEGVPYQENDCNDCSCYKENLTCTLMGCRTHNDAAYMNCKKGTTWTKYCNQCWCHRGIGIVCTAKKCEEEK